MSRYSESFDLNRTKGWDKSSFQDQPKNFMNISHSVAQRLQSGIVDQERLKNIDQNWIDKLAKIDADHTISENLDINEANRILNSLAEHSSGAIVTTCPVNKKKVIDCYRMLKGDTLKCEAEVKEFIGCIDNLLYKASHVNYETHSSRSKKMTYRERLEQICKNT